MFLLQSRSNLFGPCLSLGVLLFDTFCSPRGRTSFTSSDVREVTSSLLVSHISGETEVMQACLYTSRELHPGFITDVVASFRYTEFVPVHSPLPAWAVLYQLIPAVECSRRVSSGRKEYMERPRLQRDSPRCERAPSRAIPHLSVTKRI
jgi:hypothetical protein